MKISQLVTTNYLVDIKLNNNSKFSVSHVRLNQQYFFNIAVIQQYCQFCSSSLGFSFAINPSDSLT